MAEDDEESDGEGKPTRLNVTVAPLTGRYLDKLVEAGTHGANKRTVMARLVEEGVRQALRDGFIRKLEI